MRLLRHLQPWLTGHGLQSAGADFVPETHPLRQWADTVPWTALGAAVERSCAPRFPTPTARGRASGATRVLLALALLKHELPCAAGQIGSQLRTALAGLYACGSTEVQAERAQGPFVLPEGLAQFRRRSAAAVREERLALQAAAAIAQGVVSPAPLVVDTFPREQGRQRVNAAATL